jgi:predicted small integral membrane protein
MVTTGLTPLSELEEIEGLQVNETYAYTEETTDRVGLLHIVITFTDRSFIDLGAERVIQLESKQFYYGIGVKNAG